MEALTLTERKIPGLLEEAGEEGLAALRNTMGGCRGLPEEIDTLRVALTSLVSHGLIEIAESREELSREWVPLPKPRALDALARLGSFVRWSSADRLWEWNEDAPRAQALLTDAGMQEAHRILSENGWPRPSE